MKRFALVAMLMAGLALAACDDPDPAPRDSVSSHAPQPEMMMMADAAPQMLARSGVGAMSAKAGGPRMEVGRGYAVEITDGPVSAAMEADRDICLQLGCMITAMHTSQAAGYPTATLQALVPQDKAGDFHTHIVNAPGRVIETFNETAQNREEQYQNVQARLERLEFMRKRLYALADQKSDKVGELLQVEREILRVDTEMERLTRERRGLEKVTDNVRFTLDYRERPPKAGDIDFSPFTDLLSDAVNTAIHAVRITVLWFARWLPVIALVAVGIWWLRRRGQDPDDGLKS